MNVVELKELLASFDISEETITQFFKGRRLLKKNRNYYLVSQDFKENQIHGDLLVSVTLQRELPSRFLLDFIKKNSKNSITFSEKQALKFTYGKSMDWKTQNLSLGKNYLIEHANSVVGFAVVEKNLLKNLFNVGEYLKEN